MYDFVFGSVTISYLNKNKLINNIINQILLSFSLFYVVKESDLKYRCNHWGF